MRGRGGGCLIVVRPGKLNLLFRISHLLDLHAGGAVIIHCSNAIHTWQIYRTKAIKSGHVIAWKAIMTVEAAGLRGSGC